MTTNRDRLLTRQQAAEYLSISVDMLDRLIAGHALAVVRMGRTVRITQAALDAYIKTNTIPARQECRVSLDGRRPSLHRPSAPNTEGA